MRQFFGDLIFLTSCVAVGCLSFCLEADAGVSRLVIAAPAEAEQGAEKEKAKADKEDAGEKAEEAKEKPAEKVEEKASESKPRKEEKSKSAEEAEEDGEDEDEDEKEDKESKKKAEKKKAKPHTVKREELKIEVELDGIFVSDNMEEVALRPETWSQFKVLEAVEHGSRVKKGDVLVRFNDEKLEKELAEEALDQRLSELSLMQYEEEFPRIKRQLELAFEEAERRHTQAKENYEYYYEKDRPITIQIAKYRFKSAQEQLASAQEELDQLQQMYEADEITEETEEIVLRRQRFAVETAELVLELNKESLDYAMNVSVPRTDEYYENLLEDSELSYKQAKTAKEIGLTRKSYEMEKKRDSRARSVERHGKLLSDKGLMTIRSPADGIVYYGRCSKGKWLQITSMQAKLKPFGSASSNSVLMTIVDPESMHIEARISEKDLADMKSGLVATVNPTADDELDLEGKVTQVAGVPEASNKFKVELSVETSNAPEWLMPGMTCDANVVTYQNEEALVIPTDLVQTDEDNEKIKYVMLVDSEEEEPRRRKVKLGRKKGKIVEVLKGLEEGDEIVKEEKKDEKE